MTPEDGGNAPELQSVGAAGIHRWRTGRHVMPVTGRAGPGTGPPDQRREDAAHRHRGTAAAGGRPTRDAPGPVHPRTPVRGRRSAARLPAAEDSGGTGRASRARAAARRPGERRQDEQLVNRRRPGTTQWKGDGQVLSDAGHVGE